MNNPILKASCDKNKWHCKMCSIFFWTFGPSLVVTAKKKSKKSKTISENKWKPWCSYNVTDPRALHLYHWTTI